MVLWWLLFLLPVRYRSSLTWCCEWLLFLLPMGYRSSLTWCCKWLLLLLPVKVPG